MGRERLRRMEKQKVIIQYSVATNLRPLGYTHYRIMVGVTHNSPSLFQQLKTFVKHEKQYAYIVRAISTWDYEIGLDVKDFDEYLELLQRFKEKFKEHLLSVQTMTVRKMRVFPAGMIP